MFVPRSRKETVKQEAWALEGAKTKAGVTFFELSEKEHDILKKEGNTVYKDFAPAINKLYPGDTYRGKNFLKEVQDYMGYKP